MSFLYEKDQSVSHWVQIFSALFLYILGTIIGSIIVAAIIVMQTGAQTSEQLYVLYPLTGVVILATSYLFAISLLLMMFKRANHTKLSAMGLELKKKTAVDFLIGASVGIVAIAVIVVVTVVSGVQIIFNQIDVTMLIALFAGFCTALAEEVLFRGYIETILKIRYPQNSAIIIQAGICTLYLWLFSEIGTIAVLNVFGIALLLGLIKARTQGLFGGLGFNTVWKFFTMSSLGVSQVKSIFTLNISENIFFGSASDGIEGGLVALIVTVIIVFLISAKMTQQEQPEELERITIRFRNCQ